VRYNDVADNTGLSLFIQLLLPTNREIIRKFEHIAVLSFGVNPKLIKQLSISH